MLVNSVFKGFFNHRLVVGSGIAISMLVVFVVASSFTKHSADPDLQAKQVNLIIRQIGHRLLLQTGDSTSRVLPVTETKAGTFLLRFENEFDFNHDSLMMLTMGLLPKTQFPSGYTVTVHECLTANIAYGFQVNNTSPDILACMGRSQPPDCYTIEFVFPDFYKHAEQKKSDINQLTEKPRSPKVDPQKTNPKPEEIKNPTPDNDIDQLAVERKSLKVDPQEANSEPEAVNTTTLDYPIISLVCGGMLVLLSVALLIGRRRRSQVPEPVQNQDHPIVKASVPKLTALGKFLFDVKDQRLLLGNEVISLTDKEYRVLELLNKNFGELIPRQTLMQEVWINEGVITGRSLDMFVSKLRKKLSSDPELRITNVHGKGYKLEIPGMQV